MSWQMRAVAAYLRIARKRRYSSATSGSAVLAEPKGSSVPRMKLARTCDITRDDAHGFDVYGVRPRDGVRQRDRATVVYLHGGAFVGEIQKLHWSLIGDVATAVGCEVQVPIYGLAPQHQAEEALALVHAVLSRTSAAGPVYLMGDSAGGGLVLSAALSWRSSGGRPPLGLTLIAPWLDIGLNNPEIAAVERRDPWLSRAGLRVCGQAWAGEVPPTDPRVSPIFGELSDVPPIDLYVGTRDIAMADCRLLRDKLPPGRIAYHEEPGAVHVYPLLPVPEGRNARRRLIAHVASAMQGARAS